MAQWLRCCATNRKVAGSIPDDVIGIFHWHNPSDPTMTLGSTQPLTGDKCGRCVRLTTLLPYCAVIMKSGKLKFLEPSGSLQACNGTALPCFRDCVYDKLIIQGFWNTTLYCCKEAYCWTVLTLKMNATRSFEMSGTTRPKTPSHPKRPESWTTPMWESKISQIN